MLFRSPANAFVPVAEQLKKSTGAKIVLDVIDLWPESLPLTRARGLPPVQFWKRQRDAHIGCADVIFTECGLYRELLSLPEDKPYTLYWTREAASGTKDWPEEETEESWLLSALPRSRPQQGSVCTAEGPQRNVAVQCLHLRLLSLQLREIGFYCLSDPAYSTCHSSPSGLR